MNDWRKKLDVGKRQMKRRCIAAALQHTPPKVHTLVIRKNLSGRAYPDGRMAVPRPFTRKSLCIFLHECAHFHLGHCERNCRTPKHVREYEAEHWAHEAMREAGIPVPRSMTESARRYVAYKIMQASRRGAKRIDPAAAKFARVRATILKAR